MNNGKLNDLIKNKKKPMNKTNKEIKMNKIIKQNNK